MSQPQESRLSRVCAKARNIPQRTHDHIPFTSRTWACVLFSSGISILVLTAFIAEVFSSSSVVSYFAHGFALISTISISVVVCLVFILRTLLSKPNEWFRWLLRFIFLLMTVATIWSTYGLIFSKAIVWEWVVKFPKFHIFDINGTIPISQLNSFFEVAIGINLALSVIENFTSYIVKRVMTQFAAFEPTNMSNALQAILITETVNVSIRDNQQTEYDDVLRTICMPTSAAFSNATNLVTLIAKQQAIFTAIGLLIMLFVAVLLPNENIPILLVYGIFLFGLLPLTAHAVAILSIKGAIKNHLANELDVCTPKSNFHIKKLFNRMFAHLAKTERDGRYAPTDLIAGLGSNR